VTGRRAHPDLARALLTRAVRGRAARGTDWGEGMLRELDEVDGRWARLRWAVSGVLVARRDRLGRVFPALTLPVRIVAVAVLAVAGLAAVNQFALTIRYLPSSSMAPTMDVGQRYLVDRIGFRLTGLHYGDVVVFTDPNSNHQLAKRVIGLPHDHLSCMDGHVVRNGEVVDEPYLARDTVTDCTPVAVGEGQLYVLGDARRVSQDSRQLGPVPIAAVIGRALV
jgi:signal peptidase I